MKILIVGSGGFIGGNAVRYFLEKGYDVVECDVEQNDRKNYYVIRDAGTDFDTIFKKNSFDICINASGLADVQKSFKLPWLDFELNVQNVYRLLSGIKKHDPACRFVNFSSAAVYGNPSILPMHEGDAIRPISPYGMHKYYSELICKEFSDFSGISTCSLRVFSAYGDGLRKQLFWDLYHKQKKGNLVELSNTGSETRDFIYIDDLLFALDRIIEKADFKGECINLANGVQENILDVAMYFIKLFSVNNDIKIVGGGREGDPQNWCADITTLSKMGYVRRTDMKQGLIKYKEWLEKTG